jgi:hypothetical protein
MKYLPTVNTASPVSDSGTGTIVRMRSTALFNYLQLFYDLYPPEKVEITL